MLFSNSLSPFSRRLLFPYITVWNASQLSTCTVTDLHLDICLIRVLLVVDYAASCVGINCSGVILPLMRPVELVQCIECRSDEYFMWIFSFFFTCTSLPFSLVFCLLVQVAYLKPSEECSLFGLLGRSASLVLILGLLSTCWAKTNERLDLPSTWVRLTWQYTISNLTIPTIYIYIYIDEFKLHLV